MSSFATDLSTLDYSTTRTRTIRGIFSSTHTLDNEKHVHAQQLRPGLHRDYWHAFLRIRAARQSTYVCPRDEEKDRLYVPFPLLLLLRLPLTLYDNHH